MVRALTDSGFAVLRGAGLLKGGIVAFNLGQRRVPQVYNIHTMSADKLGDLQPHLAEKCSCKNRSSSPSLITPSVILLISFDGLLLSAVAITV
jgi:hypothetical protein